MTFCERSSVTALQQQCFTVFQYLNRNKDFAYAEDEEKVGIFMFQFGICRLSQFPECPSGFHTIQDLSLSLGFSLKSASGGAFLAPQDEVSTFINNLPAI